MSIKDYLRKDTFNYRIKFAFEPSPEQLGCIIDMLTVKYQAFDILPVVKTMFQVRPLDFSNLDAGEIWMFDFTTHRGIQDAILLTEIGKLLKCSTALIRVRNKDDMYQSALADENALELDLDEYVTKVTDPHCNSDMIEVDTAIAGQERAEQAVTDAINKHRESYGYHKYMEAAFGSEESK